VYTRGTITGGIFAMPFPLLVHDDRATLDVGDQPKKVRAMIDHLSPVDPVTHQAALARGRAADLCGRSIALVALARETRDGILCSRRRSPTRRLLSLSAGASDLGHATTDDAIIVRAKISLGRLRRDPVVGRIGVELGVGGACHGCDRFIHGDEVQMRARFADGEQLRFHAHCFTTWRAETQCPYPARPQTLREQALAVLTARPGAWYCVPCWTLACGLTLPEDRFSLRAIARSFPAAKVESGEPVFDIARCEQPTHPADRPGFNLCVRVEV